MPVVRVGCRGHDWTNALFDGRASARSIEMEVTIKAFRIDSEFEDAQGIGLHCTGIHRRASMRSRTHSAAAKVSK